MHVTKIRQEDTGNLSRVKTCLNCGAKTFPVEFKLFNKTIRRDVECDCAEKLRAQKEQQAQNERIFKRSGMGPRYQKCSLDNFKPTPGTEASLKVVMEYIAQLPKNIGAGKGILLFGPPGCGKSHLAASVVNAALGKGYTAVFERVPMLLAKIRATYNKNSTITESEIMRTLTQADLLVLDDAGAEKWTEWTEPTIYAIVDERYTYNRSLIITTNSTLDELEKKIGIRAMDRILEVCAIVENKGKSYRKAIATLDK